MFYNHSLRFKSIILLIVFCVSLCVPHLMMALYREHALGGVYFQKWSSDDMMQTLPSATLRKYPLESLYYLHKQPPMLDAIRATVVQFFPQVPDSILGIYLDEVLYNLWAILFAALTTLMVWWLWRLTSLTVALIAGLVWVFHPAPLFYATLLEGSLLSSFLIALYFYYFWKVARKEGQGIALTVVGVLLFYTRTIFQWYFFPIHFVCLLLLRVPMKKCLVSLLIAGMFITPYLVKQYKEYRTLSTTTFAGYHKCGLIWYKPSKEEVARVGKELNIEYPPGSLKYIGNERQNHVLTHAHHLIYSRIFKEQVKKDPWGVARTVIGSFWYNLKKSFSVPSADYQHHELVHRLWYKPVYDMIFSGWVYVTLMVLAALSLVMFFLSGRPIDWRQAVILLPFGFAFLIIHLANRHEWTEVERLKFFIEPLIYIVVIHQFYLRIKAIGKCDVKGSEKK